MVNETDVVKAVKKEEAKPELSLELKDFEKFRALIQAVSALVYEGTLVANKEGLKLTSMDTTNVAMVLMDWKAKDFDSYELKNAEELKFKIGFDDVKKILARIKKADKLKLYVKDSFQISVEVSGEKKKYSLPLYDIDNDEKKDKTPNLTYNLAVNMSSEKFKEIIDDMNFVGEGMSISVTKDTLSAKADESGKTKSASVVIDNNTNDVEIVINETEEEVKKRTEAKKEFEEVSRYSTSFLMKLSEGIKISDKVKVEYKKDYPIRLTFSSDNLELVSILAPRVEND